MRDERSTGGRRHVHGRARRKRGQAAGGHAMSAEVSVLVYAHGARRQSTQAAGRGWGRWGGSTEGAMDENATHLKLAKFSRYLGRISTATRVVGIIIVIAGILMLLFAVPQLLTGRHTDDALALSLAALGTGGIGLLIWGTGVFHGAVAHGLVVFGWVDGKLWEMMSSLKQQAAVAQKTAAVQVAPRAAQASALPAAAPEAVAASTEPALEPVPAAVAATTETTAAEAAMPAPQAATPELVAASEPAQGAPPATKRCKHCGAEIPSIVLRCKYCLERV